MVFDRIALQVSVHTKKKTNKESQRTECKLLCQSASKGQRGSVRRRLLMHVAACNPTAMQTPKKTL